LAYYHNAEDQIRGEAATLSFFSNGQFTNPMVLRIAGLAYQKGFGGHFHNDNSFAALRDVPGIVLACPSNGACAVKMFRRLMKEAYEYGRVCIFLEPIALYMTKDLNQKDDGLWNFTYPKENEEIEIGEFALYGKGVDLLIISYANGLYFSLQAQKILQEQFNIHTTILDLRWLAPLNSAKILECVQNFENILIVDECRKTGSISEQLSSLILENIHPTPQVKILAADDCFIPLGPAANFGLPNCETIIQWAKSFMKTKKGIHL